jgi:hypothetical protein
MSWYRTHVPGYDILGLGKVLTSGGKTKLNVTNAPASRDAQQQKSIAVKHQGAEPV